jgi:hypothetical protein
MLIDSRKPIKYFRPDLKDMIKDLREKNRELEDAI